MFQLIVAVIGIALVVILSIIAIWVGGSAFTNSGETALFATYLNQGSQIEGSLKMYQADKGVIPSNMFANDQELLEHLVDQTYLRSIPEGEWKIEGSTIYRQLADTEQCARLNTFMGKDISLVVDGTGCPPCNVAEGEVNEFSDWPGCRKDP
jgi:hypothetical protein